MTTGEKTHKHNLRCPFCGRFVGDDPDGYYDREDRDDEMGEVVCFCSQDHADKFHANKNALMALATVRKAFASAMA